MTTTTQLLAVSAVLIALYRLLLTPLARLPGPRITALTRIPLMYREFTGKRRAWVHNLHLKYGPVVRIAPDEVSFATREAVKEIYSSGGSGYDKTSLYYLFAHFDTPNMFSTLYRDKHAEIKKRFAERYNKTHVMRPEVVSDVQEQVDTFLTKCSENLGGSVDVYVLLHCFSLDVITSHLFHPNGLRSLNNARHYDMMKELTYPDILREQYFRYYFPRLAQVVAKTMGYGGLRTDGAAFVRYVIDTVRDAPVASHTLLDKLRVYDDEHPDHVRMSASECMDHLVAGLDTTVQKRLHAELISNPTTPLDDLPYLEAVLKEGLRVFTPVPMYQPRVVPDGGAVVDGVALPGGTIVSAQAWTLHRLDTNVWPDPDAFLPERWLEPKGAAERNQLFFTFGAGGRGCIGKNFAVLEMKLLLKELYSQYRTRVAPDMHASMELDDQIINSRPKGQSCLLVFEKAVPSDV